MKPTVFPEVLKDGRGFRILPSTRPTEGTTDLTNRLIRVPIHRTPFESFVRAHELGHVKWSPRGITIEELASQHKVTPDALQAAEDCRIHLGLLIHDVVRQNYNVLQDPQAGPLGVNLERFLKDEAIPLPIRLRTASQAVVSMAPFFCAIGTLLGYIRAGLRDCHIEEGKLNSIMHVLQGLPTIAATIFGNRATTSGSALLPQDFGTLLRRWGNDPDAVPGFDRTMQLAQYLDEMFPYEGAGKLAMSEELKALQKMLEESRKLPTGPAIPLLKGGTPHSLTLAPIGWGQAQLEVAPLVRNAGASRILNMKVPSDMGTRMRSIDRIFSDSKVFERRKKVLGGTVLIDTSGSMELEADQVNEIVRHAPAATVAIYNGATNPGETSCGTRFDKNTGVIRILAQRGYICRDLDYYEGPCEGANVIDGPALQWLALQRMPRVWVSDGAVTGIGEMQTDELYAEAEHLCQMHDICRIPDAEDALAAFRLLKRGIPPKHCPVCS